ncbi:MAG TPA: hypothetical protein VGG59_08560 [Acidobacteriaceae bacterium]|jgi:hypothetical protein
MTARTNAHFDEDAVTRWQMGDATEVERTHLAGCAECQAQARPLADALSCFGAAAREWGEEKAAVTREWRAAKAAAAQEWRESKAAAARSWRTMFAAWVTVSVALLLLFGVGWPRWKAHQVRLETQVLQQREQEQKQELARDNALLDEVDQDVSQVVPEAMQPLSWNAANNNAAGTTDVTASRQ